MSDTLDKTSVLNIAFEELDRAKFVLDNGKAAIRVKLDTEAGLLDGVLFDKVTGEYPNTFTEIYTYSKLGINTAKVQVVFTNSCKKYLSVLERVPL
jgi:hypothetical protein